MTGRAAVAAAVIFMISCSDARPPASAPSPGPGPAPDPGPGSPPAVRVLMLTATAGFRHESIATARQTLAAAAAAAGGITITATEDVASITRSALSGYDVLMFTLTSGELAFTAEQKAAILEFVDSGKGFVGVHSATDTLYDWPEYGRLIGTYFREHPWTQPATVVVEDASHPATAGLGGSFQLLEEFYTFRENPRPRVQVLLRLDAASVAASGDYPLAWSSTSGSGRVYYNALGHFPSTWTDERFQRQLLGAIRWTAGR